MLFPTFVPFVILTLLLSVAKCQRNDRDLNLKAATYCADSHNDRIPVLSGQSLEKFIQSHETAYVAYIRSDDTLSSDAFSRATDDFSLSLKFAKCNDEDRAKKEEIPQPGIVAHREHGNYTDKFTGALEMDSIIDFLTEGPIIQEVTFRNLMEYMNSQVPVLYIFAPTSQARFKLAQTLHPLAKKHKGIIKFTTMDPEMIADHTLNLALDVRSATTSPAIAISDLANGQKYPYDQTKTMITVESVGEFIDAFLSRALIPGVKSDPVPQIQEHAVIKAVGKTFHDIVLDNRKDVLVNFYAPWCPHSQALAPLFEDLAKKYSSSRDKLSFVSIDVTRNDVPDDRTITGFPTIRMFPAGGKGKWVEFEGLRVFKELVEFVREAGSFHATIDRDRSDSVTDKSSLSKEEPRRKEVDVVPLLGSGHNEL